MEERYPNVGFSAETVATPTEFLRDTHVIRKGITISSAARDAGNTGKTTTLRPGLVLGEITASGKYKEYYPSGSDGSEVAAGILEDQVKVIDSDANACDAMASMIVHGRVNESALLLCDAAAKSDLPAIIFD